LNTQEDLVNMTEEVRSALRKKCLRSLFDFSVAVMGYDDITEDLHGRVCQLLESPSARKQITLPRGFIKTWLCTIAYSIWISLPRTEADEFPLGVSSSDPFYNLGPNIRILIASYVIGNAMKMLGLIRKTYEMNQAMMILFPEVIPENFNKQKWSNLEACINRSDQFTESTFEAGGIGGSTTSRHYDLIIEDDLIYAKKDDLTGKELQPDQDDIDKAIGWHKLATSLLVPKAHTRIHNIGTRWAKQDLIHYIVENEPDYECFHRAATLDGSLEGEPTWPEAYGREKLKKILAAQGTYMFHTQYLNQPMAPEDMLFKAEWLQFYLPGELPEFMRIFTTVDLSGWTEPKRKGNESRGVVLTCGICPKNHLWLLHYDVGRFDPSQVIDLFYKHQKLFNPEYIYVESVYYQKSIMHFAHKEMELRGWLPLRELKTDSSQSKELRIRALEPFGSNLAIHCKKEHRDFIQEWIDYVPNSSCRKDIIDALAYQIQVMKPGQIETLTTRDRTTGIIKIEYPAFETIEWAWDKKKRLAGLFQDALTSEEETLMQEDNPFVLDLSNLENLGD
jgi:hypothetical protein